MLNVSPDIVNVMNVNVPDHDLNQREERTGMFMEIVAIS
jgi:hypothetical protein